MPYYRPYHQAMLVHYSPPSYGRSSATSAFAAGDAVGAGTVIKGTCIFFPTFSNILCRNVFLHRKSRSR